MSMASSILPSAASSSRKPPSGSVTDWRKASPFTSMISRLPPPRSPAKPSGERKPIMMPLAASSASRWPDRIWILAPSACSPRAMKSGPSEASRQAAVAIAQMFLTPRMRAIALKRLSASSAHCDAFLAEVAGRSHLPAEAAQNLLVEDRRRAATAPS